MFGLIEQGAVGRLTILQLRQSIVSRQWIRRRAKEKFGESVLGTALILGCISQTVSIHFWNRFCPSLTTPRVPLCSDYEFVPELRSSSNRKIFTTSSNHKHWRTNLLFLVTTLFITLILLLRRSGLLSPDTARSPSTEWRSQGEIDMLLGIQTNDE